MPSFDFRGGNDSIIWTTSDYNNEEMGGELPYIELTEYVQSASQIKQQINYWAQRGGELCGGGGVDSYKGLYIGNKTENTYTLPYFTELHHQIGQNWQENQGALGDMIKNIADKAVNVAKAFSPAAGILQPKSYAGTNEYFYDIQFHLINTVSDEGIKKNKTFLETFIKQNLHVQHNPVAITPPCLYTAWVPGVRWSPVCIVSNLSVSNKGTLNVIDGYIIPDAWEIRIQFRELINESRAMYNDAIHGPDSEIKVRVIDG